MTDLRARLIRAQDESRGASSDFDLHPGFRPPESRRLRPAAVLVPVVPEGEGTVVLTKRSSALKHHPGQIALPGGKIETVDGGPEGAALREASEEIGLDPERADVLGRLPPHETVTGFTVTPVLALVPGQAWVAEPGEVDEVFEVPLSHVLDASRYRVESRLWRGQRRRYFVAPWGPYYIWGATARILRGLAEAFR